MRRSPAASLLGTIAFLLVLLLSLPATTAAEADAEPDLAAASWYLIDSRDGTVLAASSPDRRRPIASATKMMTARIAMQRLKMTDIARAVNYRADPAESLMGLEPGQLVSVRDLLYGLILLSGNDAAVTLARAAAGSVPRFVAMMNAEARKLGLKNTHFANPVGLDAPRNYSTAADLAELGRKMMEDPVFRKIAASRRAVLRSLTPPQPIETRNTLLFTLPWANGIKTGHTLTAGYVLVGSGRLDNVELTAAVLGTDSVASRDAETAELLEYGMSRYPRVRAVRRGEILRRIEIRHSSSRLPLRAARGFAVRRRKDQTLRVRLRTPSAVEGPIDAGQRLGRAIVFLDGQRLRTIPLRAARAVPAPTLLDRFAHWSLRYVFLALSGLFVILITGALIRRSRRNYRGGARGRPGARRRRSHAHEAEEP